MFSGKNPFNRTEKFIIGVIVGLIVLMIIPNVQIEPTWNKNLSNEIHTRNVQLAVDSFVAKKFIEPVDGNNVASCLTPKQLDFNQLKESTINPRKEFAYFLDTYGRVWAEKKSHLLTVTKQENKVVFNNVKADKYEIWSVQGNNCENRKKVTVIENNGEEHFIFNVEEGVNYLIQPIYKEYKHMPVGVGFDGRLYK